MCRRSVYVAMELWKVPQQDHFVFVIFINFTIESVAITSGRWPSRGKFLLGLPDILFVANNTSRYINTMVCACQFLVEWDGFIFAHYLWNTWHMEASAVAEKLWNILETKSSPGLFFVLTWSAPECLGPFTRLTEEYFASSLSPYKNTMSQHFVCFGITMSYKQYELKWLAASLS